MKALTQAASPLDLLTDEAIRLLVESNRGVDFLQFIKQSAYSMRSSSVSAIGLKRRGSEVIECELPFCHLPPLAYTLRPYRLRGRCVHTVIRSSGVILA